MQVSKWGNSLAVRLPADLVRRLGLREGDEISLHAEEGGLAVLRQPDEVLADLRRFRGRLDPVNRLDRDSANAR